MSDLQIIPAAPGWLVVELAEDGKLFTRFSIIAWAIDVAALDEVLPVTVDGTFACDLVWGVMDPRGQVYEYESGDVYYTLDAAKRAIQDDVPDDLSSAALKEREGI
jgi:hypothetical protein